MVAHLWPRRAVGAVALMCVLSMGACRSAPGSTGVPIVHGQPAVAGGLFEVEVDTDASVNGDSLILNATDRRRVWSLSWATSRDDVGDAFEFENPRVLIQTASEALLAEGSTIFVRVPDEIEGRFRLCYGTGNDCTEVDVVP